jgi:ABC-type dipeptide/oligopeptide/nickel transport system ATPase component
MLDPSSYVTTIKRIKEDEKKLRQRVKEKQVERKKYEERLYKYMLHANLEEFSGIKIKSIAPKPKVPRKKKGEKHKAAIDLLSNVGMPDPEAFYKEFTRTQTNRQIK